MRTAPAAALNAQAYFDLVRKARTAVKIPDSYDALKAPITVDPDEVEEAFVKANPGLSRSGVAVTCDSSRLSEVRICMSKDLKFRDCAEIDRRACRRDKLIMPPVRGSELIRRTGLNTQRCGSIACSCALSELNCCSARAWSIPVTVCTASLPRRFTSRWNSRNERSNAAGRQASRAGCPPA